MKKVQAVMWVIAFSFILGPGCRKSLAEKADLRKIKPIGGIPVERLGKGLDRWTKATPSNEAAKWLTSLSKTTGEDNAQLFLQCMNYFGSRMTLFFDEKDNFQKDISDRFRKRLESIKEEEFKLWYKGITEQATDNFWGGEAAVALTLLPVDKLYEKDLYVPDRGRKYLSRLKSVPTAAIQRWEKEVDQFKGSCLDAAINIILLDQFFNDDKFNLGVYEQELNALK